MFFDIAIATGPDPTGVSRVLDAIERNAFLNYAVTLCSAPGQRHEMRRQFGDDWRVHALATAPADGDGAGVFTRWNNALAGSRADAILVMTDDLELYPQTLYALRQAFERWGLDTMAPLRIARGDARGPALGAMALGAAFIDRFARRQCFCPDYRWFHGDTELMDFARQAGCLRLADAARAIRFTTPALAMDPGHIREGRKRRRRDGRILGQRRRAGWLWGRDTHRLQDGSALSHAGSRDEPAGRPKRSRHRIS